MPAELEQQQRPFELIVCFVLTKSVFSSGSTVCCADVSFRCDLCPLSSVLSHKLLLTASTNKSSVAHMLKPLRAMKEKLKNCFKPGWKSGLCAQQDAVHAFAFSFCNKTAEVKFLKWGLLSNSTIWSDQFQICCWLQILSKHLWQSLQWDSIK